jgi:SAM-dependent methyltransferase
LEYVLRWLGEGRRVLDIGCHEGYFSRALAERGFDVTAIDINYDSVAVSRYLALINNLPIKCHISEWQCFGMGYYDVVLMFSVLHLDMYRKSVEQTFRSLRLFEGRVGKLFIEVPLNSSDVWKGPLMHIFHFSEEDFAARVSSETGMKLAHIWHPTGYGSNTSTFLFEGGYNEAK